MRPWIGAAPPFPSARPLPPPSCFSFPQVVSKSGRDVTAVKRMLSLCLSCRVVLRCHQLSRRPAIGTREGEGRGGEGSEGGNLLAPITASRALGSATKSRAGADGHFDELFDDQDPIQVHS